ncbi:MAG TPA: MerC domain-containing protein [Sphingomicrobium sp.]|nr:MerC domain-containing protein [Sphingomicrobium sp.]
MGKTERMGKAADGLAIGASLLCIVHCLLLPLAIALLPALGGLIDVPETAHLILFLLAVPVSSLAVVSGYRRHGALVPGLIAATGLVLIGIGALVGLSLLVETSVTIAGSLALALAHLWNLSLKSARIGGDCMN